MIIIAIDPSGSFNEGKGHTGFAITDTRVDFIQTFDAAAKDFPNRHEYWKWIISTVLAIKPDIVVIESFVVRSNGFLIGKMPETPMLIGALVWELEKRNIKYTFQSPSQAKTRFKDAHLGRYLPDYEIKDTARGRLYYLNGKLTNDHQRDAIKHLLYYKKYNKRED